MGIGMGMGRGEEANLKILRGSDAPLLDVPLQSTDRVLSAPHLLDLVTGTVGGSGVGHPVCHSFQVLSKGKTKTNEEDDLVSVRRPQGMGKNVRVTTVTVSNKFEEQRALARDCPFTCVFHALRDSDDVHTVDLFHTSHTIRPHNREQGQH